jgi:hypothetical protein
MLLCSVVLLCCCYCVVTVVHCATAGCVVGYPVLEIAALLHAVRLLC